MPKWPIFIAKMAHFYGKNGPFKPFSVDFMGKWLQSIFRDMDQSIFKWIAASDGDLRRRLIFAKTVEIP